MKSTWSNQLKKPFYLYKFDHVTTKELYTNNIYFTVRQFTWVRLTYMHLKSLESLALSAVLIANNFFSTYLTLVCYNYLIYSFWHKINEYFYKSILLHAIPCLHNLIRSRFNLFETQVLYYNNFISKKFDNCIKACISITLIYRVSQNI